MKKRRKNYELDLIISQNGVSIFKTVCSQSDAIRTSNCVASN